MLCKHRNGERTRGAQTMETWILPYFLAEAKAVHYAAKKFLVLIRQACGNWVPS